MPFPIVFCTFSPRENIIALQVAVFIFRKKPEHLLRVRSNSVKLLENVIIFARTYQFDFVTTGIDDELAQLRSNSKIIEKCNNRRNPPGGLPTQKRSIT